MFSWCLLVSLFPSDLAGHLERLLTVVAVGYIYIDQVWERPGTGHLLEASGVRMGFDACQAYEMWSNMSRYGMGDGRGIQNMLPIP